MDGSSVAGKLSVSELAVDTRFGPLKIPVDQIKSFAPGLKSHPEFQAKLNGLIGDLSAEAFADREKAQDELQAMGIDIKGELELALKTAEAEKEMRLTKILEEFESTAADDSAANTHAWVADDVIVTDGFTIVGHITTGNFAIESPYGVLQLKLADVREARRDGLEPEDIRKTITVAGTTVGNHNFTASGLRLNKGDQVTIAAIGSIQMTPFGNQQSGPDGGANFGAMPPENILGGTLVGRVGKTGEVIKLGSNHTFTVTKAGVLEMGIAMNQDFAGSPFPGEYTVKVRVVRKSE